MLFGLLGAVFYVVIVVALVKEMMSPFAQRNPVEGNRETFRMADFLVHPGISWASPGFRNTLKGNESQFLAKSPKTHGFSTQGNSSVPIDPR